MKSANVDDGTDNFDEALSAAVRERRFRRSYAGVLSSDDEDLKNYSSCKARKRSSMRRAQKASNSIKEWRNRFLITKAITAALRENRCQKLNVSANHIKPAEQKVKSAVPDRLKLTEGVKNDHQVTRKETKTKCNNQDAPLVTFIQKDQPYEPGFLKELITKANGKFQDQKITSSTQKPQKCLTRGTQTAPNNLAATRTITVNNNEDSDGPQASVPATRHDWDDEDNLEPSNANVAFDHAAQASVALASTLSAAATFSSSNFHGSSSTLTASQSLSYFLPTPPAFNSCTLHSANYATEEPTLYSRSFLDAPTIIVGTLNCPTSVPATRHDWDDEDKLEPSNANVAFDHAAQASVALASTLSAAATFSSSNFHGSSSTLTSSQSLSYFLPTPPVFNSCTLFSANDATEEPTLNSRSFLNAPMGTLNRPTSLLQVPTLNDGLYHFPRPCVTTPANGDHIRSYLYAGAPLQDFPGAAISYVNPHSMRTQPQDRTPTTVVPAKLTWTLKYRKNTNARTAWTHAWAEAEKFKVSRK